MGSVRYGNVEFREAYGAAWSSGDEALFRAYFAPEVVYVEGGAHTRYEGVDQAARFFRFMRAFSPDSRIEFTSLAGDTRGFGAEWVWSGTASGKLLLDGIVYPAANRPYRIDGAAICRADAEGRVTYHKDFYDMRSLLKQLGYFSI